MSALAMISLASKLTVISVMYIVDDLGETVDKVSVLMVGPARWLVTCEPRNVPDQYTQMWVFDSGTEAMNKALRQCGWGELAQG